MITIQKYVRAQSLEEAWQLNQNKRSRILGGMLWLRLGKGSVNTAIDLSHILNHKTTQSIHADVIVNQSADWCGDPPDSQEYLGDCHASVRTGSQ